MGGMRGFLAAGLALAAAAWALPAVADELPRGLTIGPATGPGADLYAQHCATCHDNPTDRIPPKLYLTVMKTPEQIVRALTEGVMQPQGSALSDDERKLVAAFITGKQFGSSPDPDPKANMCRQAPPPLDFTAGDWNGWGLDPANSRFQRNPGLTAADVPKLKLKWAFAYPGNLVDGQPVVVGGRLFVTSRAGRVFSLDPKTGCTHWAHDVGSSVRTAPVIGKLPSGAPAKFAAYYATENGQVQALDAETGAVLWTTRVEDHPVTRLTGSPVLFENRLYVPLASMEEVSVRDPKYPCCTFRGGVVSVDAVTGKVVWKAHTIDEEAKQIGVRPNGAPMFGPAGASTFSPPTIDARRRRVYLGTGNSYTQVSIPTANALAAFDLDSGKRLWATQILPDDNVCPEGAKAQCTGVGPDFDFGAPPILHRMADGTDIILAASKGGDVYGFDPEGGRILWKTQVATGSSLAGPWGIAADRSQVYVGTPDQKRSAGGPMGGLNALDIKTGKLLWHRPAPPAVCSWGNAGQTITAAFGADSCSPSQPGALAAMPGVVFSGSIDGHMRAYSTKDGSNLWDVDTAQTFDAVNGAKASGGSISTGAQTVALGMLFVNSGVGGVHQTGNALLAYSVDGK